MGLDSAPRSDDFERLEPRVMLDGDHPGLPNPWVAGQGTLVALNSGAAETSQLRGRGVAGGTIASGDGGDLFRFVMPSTAGRPNDLVTVYADGLLGTNNTTEYPNPKLDSTVTVYDNAGNVLASGTNNGRLSSSPNPVPDAWTSFIGIPGNTYYVLVRGQTTDVAAGRASTGSYTLRLDAATVDAPLGPGGSTNPSGTIGFRGDENVFRVVTGSGSDFNGIATVGAIATTGSLLDTHAGVYASTSPNTQASELANDNDAGRLTNAFAVWKINPSSTYFVRVRSDVLSTAGTATGNFVAQTQTIAENIAVSDVTRRGSATGNATGPAGLPAGTGTAMFRFLAQGTGLGVVTVLNTDFPPLDMSLRVYDSNGTFVGFNDNYIGLNPEIRAPVVGNRTYFAIVDSFNQASDAAFVLSVEMHATFDPLTPVDDHVNIPASTATAQDRIRGFGLSTALRFGAPVEPALDDQSVTQTAVGNGRIFNFGDTDLFQFVPPITMKGNYAGKSSGDPAEWEGDDLPSSRVDMVLAPAEGEPFLQPLLRVYDSKFNLVFPRSGAAPYSFTDNTGKIWSRARNPLNPFDPLGGFAGMIDPASVAGPGDAPNESRGITVWGGETYYVEVGGIGTGRYDLNVRVDGVGVLRPTPFDVSGPFNIYGDNFVQDPPPGPPPRPPTYRSVYAEPIGAGAWSNALLLSMSDSVGQTRVAVDSTISWPFTPGFFQRFYAGTPASDADGGTTVIDFVGLPAIETPGDTDLFRVRAPATGTIEFRIVTRNIVNSYSNVRITAPAATAPMGTPDTIVQDIDVKSYDSPLYSAMRVFDNDFVELKYQAGRPSVTGAVEGDTYAARFGLDGVQDPNDRTFTARDARIVIPVVAGNTYFVQIESAFRAAFAANPDLVDYRHATGTYELLINATPAPNTIDDFENFTNDLVLGTALVVNETTGAASPISGTIRNVTSGPILNQFDNDTFRYVAPARGTGTLTLTPAAGFQGQLLVLDGNGVVVAQRSANTPGATINLPINVQKGDRYFFIVAGVEDSQGDYTLEFSGPGSVNTDAESGFWSTATPLTLNRFLGQYNATGRLQFAGDTDLFQFDALNYEVATITVNGTSDNFDPFVRVFEIGDDGSATPVFLQITFNDNRSPTDRNARATFSVTPGRRYFAQVEGAGGESFGSYALSVQVAATDDHPNRTDFPTASAIPVVFDPLSFSVTGSITGLIEISGDNDFFRFSSQVGGQATVTITTPGSTLAPSVLIVGEDNLPLPGVTYSINSTTATAQIPSISANVSYYVVVQPQSPPPGGRTATGAYTVSLVTTPIDDYPNFGDALSTAAIISLSNVSGIGTRSGVIVPSTDTDLFRFDTLAAGVQQIRVTTSGSDLNPRLRILNSSGVVIGTVDGNGDSAAFAITASGAGERYYIVVDRAAGTSGATAVGNYVVTVVGTIPGGGGPGPGGGPDDHANAGEWNDASVVPIASATGFGSAGGTVNFIGDTDLFRFRAVRAGAVDLQINIPGGGQLDARVRIFNAARQPVVDDTIGIPGATASVQFNADPNVDYFVLVEPVGTSLGSYTVRVQSQPQSYFLFFPEGYAGPNIDQFVPIVNDNNFAVDYSIFARYETGERRTTPIATGTIPANSRGGVTITSRSQPASASLVDFDRPYALEMFSSGRISATLSHYDFGASVGEAFTSITSTTWTFAQAHRDRNTFRDFLLFYNPNESATANITVTLFYTTGQVVTFSQPLEGQRRGGVNFDNDSRVTTNGTFGIRVTSNVPIVSSLTSFNLLTSGGDGLLGDPDGGSLEGVVSQGIQTSSGVASSYGLLNTNEVPVNVTITANYGRLDLPALVRTVTIPARTAFTQTFEALGLLSSQTAGITYSSSAPVTFQVTQYQNGDGDIASTQSAAAKTWLFADLFINPTTAGTIYLEQLGLYNPAAFATQVTLSFFYADGSAVQSRTLTVPANGFNFYRLDQDPFILSRTSPTGFSLRVSSATPIVAMATHYDLFLAGGWAMAGQPIGLLNPLSTI
jgi:hypothetical protein